MAATAKMAASGTSTTGTYYFDQTTPGTTNVLKDLTLSGSTTATLGNTLNITAGATAGTVIVGSGTTLNAGGNLIIKSNATGTARIGTSSGTISGNVVVERYLPATRRAYRFLAAPVTTTGGVYASWQESGTNAAGLGIQVSGIAGAFVATIGIFLLPFIHMTTWFPHAMGWMRRQKYRTRVI
jgi:hypothetical protein